MSGDITVRLTRPQLRAILAAANEAEAGELAETLGDGRSVGPFLRATEKLRAALHESRIANHEPEDAERPPIDRVGLVEINRPGGSTEVVAVALAVEEVGRFPLSVAAFGSKVDDRGTVRLVWLDQLAETIANDNPC